MLPIHDNQSADLNEILARLAPPQGHDGKISATVASVLEDVARRGDQALVDYAQKFDRVTLSAETLRVPDAQFENLDREVPAPLQAAVLRAIENIERFHKGLLPQSHRYQGDHGEVLESRVGPIARAGLYVPGGAGGATPLLSTLLMNAVPARIAGVPEIFVCTPPRADGTIHPALRFACGKLGLREVYRVGGAQAIGAMAYGTKSIPAAHVICGPGNAYVTEAKRQVFGRVKIDGIFGHSEIVVIADDTARPDFIAADLMSQAEHAGGEMAVLITPSRSLAALVNAELKARVPKQGRSEAITSSLSTRGATFVVQSLDEAIAIANRIAPEHLELHTREDERLLEKVTAAGAVFCGKWASEPIGDYIAGTNHVLPTGGAARFSSPLGVETFMKRTQVIRYTAEAFKADGGHAKALAAAEGLEAHRGALEIRG